jgi:hypothetical protein
VPLSTTTTRALAASLALVAAGATFAGTAAFHLPVLGFTQPARAALAAREPRPVQVRRLRPKPVRVVRTRVVTDVVHRPAPTPVSAPVAVVSPVPVAAAVPPAIVYVPAQPAQQKAPPRPVLAPGYHGSTEPEHDGRDDSSSGEDHSDAPNHQEPGGDS